MAVHGNKWQYMVIHGYTWQHMVIHGNSWLYTVIYGYTWSYIENTSWKVPAYGIYARVVDVSEIERVRAANE